MYIYEYPYSVWILMLSGERLRRSSLVAFARPVVRCHPPMPTAFARELEIRSVACAAFCSISYP